VIRQSPSRRRPTPGIIIPVARSVRPDPQSLALLRRAGSPDPRNRFLPLVVTLVGVFRDTEGRVGVIDYTIPARLNHSRGNHSIMRNVLLAAAATALMGSMLGGCVAYPGYGPGYAGGPAYAPTASVSIGWHGDNYWDGHRYWARHDWESRHPEMRREQPRGGRPDDHGHDNRGHDNRGHDNHGHDDHGHDDHHN